MAIASRTHDELGFGFCPAEKLQKLRALKRAHTWSHGVAYQDEGFGAGVTHQPRHGAGFGYFGGGAGFGHGAEFLAFVVAVKADDEFAFASQQHNGGGQPGQNGIYGVHPGGKGKLDFRHIRRDMHGGSGEDVVGFEGVDEFDCFGKVTHNKVLPLGAWVSGGF